MSNNFDVPHPGVRIRTEVIPVGMSVTAAAKLIGVGRPALSNLLNGNAALSEEMAMRLAKAFNKCSFHDLMAMQTQYDASRAIRKSPPANTIAFVPPFLTIKANAIESWASRNIPARSRFAVFLRTLVHSTGRGLTKVDFPGNDDAERPGWDGFVEAAEGTPWVPCGRSGWEFGTNNDPKRKANKDFAKALNVLEEKERSETVFIFVTPRHWPGKEDWVIAHQAKQLWKEVRAYDSSDLEQWLAQSLQAQAWFANETDMPGQQDVRSLDKCWADWANVTDPPLTVTLFESAIKAAKRVMTSRLSAAPNGPILITADSTEEALAFLAQLLSERGGEGLAAYRDRVLVFDKPDKFPRLAMGAQTFIPVAYTREVERELAPRANSMHSIIIYPRNATSATPDVVLEPANHETFTRALEEMDMNRDETSKYVKESGRSLTVLRRRLANIPAVTMPEWAADRKTAESLVPFLLVGAWESTNGADRQGLSLLSGDIQYENLEKNFQSLAQLNDVPVWSIGKHRGIVSKIDLLYAIGRFVTSEDLQRYYQIAQLVLGEDDPTLDLSEDQRWAAAIHGKTREFSRTFRNGISETLVLLGVHGPDLFDSRLGVNTELEVRRVVRELLPTPLTTRSLEANDDDLPIYAEAAPEEFLSLLERDLKSGEPAVLGLLRPARSGLLGGSPSRTGLLWALEGLSWNPATLPRAVLILARLAQVEINDNWVNKPIHSLESIFRSWMPQTAASHQVRVDLMKNLAAKFPEIAWKLCTAQFGEQHQVGHYSHKPRWRSDGYGFGEPITGTPRDYFVREMVEMALNWKIHSFDMLCDLVECAQNLCSTDQARIWELVEAWATNKASDAEKSKMREKIRVWTLSPHAALRAKKNGDTNLVPAGKRLIAALEPSDPLNKHAWLFYNQWVQESADEMEDMRDGNRKKSTRSIENLRIDALREIFEQQGPDGILNLAQRGEASRIIGYLLTSSVLPIVELDTLLRKALAAIFEKEEQNHFFKSLVNGALRAAYNQGTFEAVLDGATSGLSDDERAEVYGLAPFAKQTWLLVEKLSDVAQARYWREVIPDPIFDSDSENSEAIERLLKANRPRAAFQCAHFQQEKLDPQLLFRLLAAMAEGGEDQSGQYRLDPHDIARSFKCLDKSPALSLDQKARLEFDYIEVLTRSRIRRKEHIVPNLERYIEAHPELFVQAIAWTFKRKDHSADPEAIQVPADQVETMASLGYHLIHAIRRIPGHNDLGELEKDRLSKWVTTVRKSCADLGRAKIADICIGEVLSYAPIGNDGIWPCEPVRDVMEEIQSEILMEGAGTGIYNSRGTVTRGEGGGQERELAEKYRRWGRALQVSHPFVATNLLMKIANVYESEGKRWDTEAELGRRLH